jgi:hypothetical protein
MDPAIYYMNKQKIEKMKTLEILERKNFILRDKIFVEKENMKKLKSENILLNILLSKVKYYCIMNHNFSLSHKFLFIKYTK